MLYPITVFRVSRTMRGAPAADECIVEVCRCSGGLRQLSEHARGGSHVSRVSLPATTPVDEEDDALLSGFGSFVPLPSTTSSETAEPPGAMTLTVSATVTLAPAAISPRLQVN